MSNIFEALEQAQREKNGMGKGRVVAVPDDDPIEQIRHDEPPVETARIAADKGMATLYRTIDLLLPEQSQKVIQFISSHQGEGVSTVVREIAKTAATKLGRKVLILDATHHNPPQRLVYDAKRPPDAHELQETFTKGCCRSGNGNLCIASFPSSSSTSYYVDIKTSVAILEDLRKQFDLILIDSSSLAATPDSVAYARFVDGVILVLEAEKTKWFIAEELKGKILKNGGNILGVVFNKRRYHIPKFIYERLC